MKENFSNLVKEIDTQVQEAQRVPSKMDAKKPTPRQIITKMSNVNDKENLKNNKRNADNYLQGSSHKNVG